MLALELLGGAVVLVGLALVVGRQLPTLTDEPEDTRDAGLPEGRLLRSDDIPRLRFRVGLRGYRMTDVDAALEAARMALAAAEGRPSRSTGGPGSPAVGAVAPPVIAEQPPDSENVALSQLERLHPPADDTA